MKINGIFPALVTPFDAAGEVSISAVRHNIRLYNQTAVAGFVALGSTGEAVTDGVASTARIITGAALIIVVVFSGFARGQLVMFQQMGFGVATALLLDATLIRMVILPSALSLLGHRSWYLPPWLRWMPHLEVKAPGA